MSVRIDYEKNYRDNEPCRINYKDQSAHCDYSIRAQMAAQAEPVDLVHV
jgi:hypothetical protein